MGSWSVYCGVSQIAITSGQKCVLIVLKENRYGEYDEYIPATLPIYGEYDDYGGLENIEVDENTKLIEEHFNCTIDEFCRYFTRGCVSKTESDFPKFLIDNEEIEKWKFMFMDREVYEFMSTFIGEDEKGMFDFGNKEILELLGFTYNGKVDKVRFNQEWEIQGKKFYSDGNWLQTEKDESIYNLNKSFNKLSDKIELDNTQLQYTDKSMWQMWSYLKESDAKNLILSPIGYRYNEYSSILLEELLTERLKEKAEKLGIPYVEPILKTIRDKYIHNYLKFGNELCGLKTVRYNLHPMSSNFKPYVLYTTPQCGDYNNHQILLDKFAEINKQHIIEY